jgi:hypothetical protein
MQSESVTLALLEMAHQSTLLTLCLTVSPPQSTLERTLLSRVDALCTVALLTTNVLLVQTLSLARVPDSSVAALFCLTLSFPQVDSFLLARYGVAMSSHLLETSLRRNKCKTTQTAIRRALPSKAVQVLSPCGPMRSSKRLPLVRKAWRITPTKTTSATSDYVSNKTIYLNLKFC